jgi:hypothetical protein
VGEAREGQLRAGQRAQAEGATSSASFEEASKSELQRQTEALEAARQQSEQAQRDALRYRIALDHGSLRGHHPPRGQTEDELKANAEWLASVKAAATPPAKPVPQRPTEQLAPARPRRTS